MGSVLAYLDERLSYVIPEGRLDYVLSSVALRPTILTMAEHSFTYYFGNGLTSYLGGIRIPVTAWQF